MYIKVYFKVKKPCQPHLSLEVFSGMCNKYFVARISDRSSLTLTNILKDHIQEVNDLYSNSC